MGGEIVITAAVAVVLGLGMFTKLILNGRRELSHEIVKQRGEIADWRAKVVKQRGEIADWRAEVAGLRGEIADWRAEVAGLRGEIGDWRAEHIEVRSELAQLHEFVVPLKGLRDALTGRRGAR